MMLVTTLAAKAAAGAGAAASAVGGAISSTGALTALSAGSGALQAYSNFRAAGAQSQQLGQAAIDEMIAKNNDSLNAQRRVTEINRQFLDVAGQQRVAFAANGIDLGSGSVRAARSQSLREANKQIGQIYDDDALNRRIRDVRARGYRRAARSTRAAGLLSAAGTVGSTALDIGRTKRDR